MDDAEADVSNFRQFQARGNRFFDSAEAVWKQDRRRRSRNLIVLGIIAAVLTPGIWRGVHWTVQTVDLILEIEQEWKSAHPAEFKQPETGTTNPAMNASSEDAKDYYIGR